MKLIFSREIEGNDIAVRFDEKNNNLEIEANGETIAAVKIREAAVVVYTVAAETTDG